MLDTFNCDTSIDLIQGGPLGHYVRRSALRVVLDRPLSLLALPGLLHAFLFLHVHDEVLHGEHGAVEDHAGAGVAHGDADLFAHRGLVAGRGTVGAERLLLATAARVHAAVGVVGKLRALRAQRPFGRAVRVVAIQGDHQAHDALLICLAVLFHDAPIELGLPNHFYLPF